MGKILGQIQPRNFEVIRQRIGEILAFELVDQEYTKNVTVWNDRSIAFDKVELPAVNVVYEGTGYNNQNAKSKASENSFSILVYVQNESTDTDDGDKLSSHQAQRIAGIIDFILTSPEYTRLDFAPGIIASKQVESIDIGKASNGDSLNTIVAILKFKVNSIETVNDLFGIAGEVYSTKITIEETNKGHYFVINQ